MGQGLKRENLAVRGLLHDSASLQAALPFQRSEFEKLRISSRRLQRVPPPTQIRLLPLKTSKLLPYAQWKAAGCFRFHRLDRNTGPEDWKAVAEGRRTSVAVPMAFEEPSC